MELTRKGTGWLAGIGLAVFALGQPAPEAVLFAPGAVSLPGTQESPNGLTALDRFSFTRCAADFTGCQILEATLADPAWRVTGPAPSAPPPPSAGASPAASGALVYFHSTPKLPGEGAGADWKIWESARAAGQWSHRRLPAPVNTEARECCVAALSPGVFYFASDRDGAWEIFRAAAAGDSWTVAKLPATINGSRSGQWPSAVGAGERLLLFSSIRAGGHGGDDVYVTFRNGDSWSAPRALPAPVNSPAFEDSARVSPDGRHLFWSSNRPLPSGDRSANVYRIPIGRLLDP